MTKKLQKYFSLIREIDKLKDGLASLVKEEKPVKTIDDKFILTLVREFPNSSMIRIELLAFTLVGPIERRRDRITGRIWSMIDREILTLDSELKLICKEEEK